MENKIYSKLLDNYSIRQLRKEIIELSINLIKENELKLPMPLV